MVVTYAELLRALLSHVEQNRAWRVKHPDQHFFMRQMFQHFVEGPASMNTEDTISFISTMCETGESARYGHRPRDVAIQEFVDLVAEHARRQFEDSRATLAAVKNGLRTYSRSVLAEQVNERIDRGPIEKVVTRFVGKWEWCVELQRVNPHPTIFLEFGPTAAVEQHRALLPVEDPDYSRVFISLWTADGSGIQKIVQTDVGLAEAIDGLTADDHRLCDGVLRVAAAA
ncbi:hypothetical protein BH708_16370 [Brachybacterium sp. P6-10-X1]|uniref:hypothetical protein n=1 Tax=Brachybacterium sp. P6-10-X1 TaxID=1903186 RepID=UPI00097175D1|nr:hypothetical protein [Brachybacterium sp. P6-10-X1]APX34025.1 hypothetical protein BH708_16370 [Brachybacterium sp. P6-10-X1]